MIVVVMVVIRVCSNCGVSGNYDSGGSIDSGW